MLHSDNPEYHAPQYQDDLYGSHVYIPHLGLLTKILCEKNLNLVLASIKIIGNCYWNSKTDFLLAIETLMIKGNFELTM